ncbi:MAG: hypothetical protein JXA71_12510 [Chitinispirillaceae bacterium]|nr:hypothetical protein [Chitinispirillaceae bacterium]
MHNIRPLVLANSLHGFHIHAKDGSLGRIDDFYFNDESWKIHNVVVDLGNWLPGRKVLIVPDILGHADWRKKFIEARTTRELIRKSPGAETTPPVAIQKERDIVSTIAADPRLPEVSWGMHQNVPTPSESGKPDDLHLRSTRILKDSSIIDENLAYRGSVSDFLVDTETWEIRFLFLKTMDSRVFLIHPASVIAFNVENRKITIRHPDDEKAEWQEYDPHHMAVLEMLER